MNFGHFAGQIPLPQITQSGLTSAEVAINCPGEIAPSIASRYAPSKKKTPKPKGSDEKKLVT